MTTGKNSRAVIEESAEALGTAHSALAEELDNRKKLGQEMRDTEPGLQDALADSDSALALTDVVLNDNVNEQVMEIAVKESAEALKATGAVLEQELEKRKELETALAETEGDLVTGMQKAGDAKTRLTETLDRDS